MILVYSNVALLYYLSIRIPGEGGGAGFSRHTIKKIARIRSKVL